MMSSHKSLYGKWQSDVVALDLTHRPTCILFSRKQQISLQAIEDEKCSCGRWKRSHTYADEPKTQNGGNWNIDSCSKSVEDTENFGILYNPYELCSTKV